MYTVYIQDYFGGDIELEVSGHYQPAEAMTRHYPGCSEQFEIEQAIVTETGAEVCLIDDAEIELQEQILTDVHEERSYRKYGYMLDY